MHVNFHQVKLLKTDSQAKMVGIIIVIIAIARMVNIPVQKSHVDKPRKNANLGIILFK